jgi:hypothetical protein
MPRELLFHFWDILYRLHTASLYLRNHRNKRRLPDWNDVYGLWTKRERFLERAYVLLGPSNDDRPNYTWPQERDKSVRRPFQRSLTWFESKLNLTHLEYSFHTCFEQILRNVKSKPNREVSVMFIRNRLRTINCSRVELKMFISLGGLWLVFEWYQIVALKDTVHHRGKGTITIRFTLLLCPSRWIFKEIPMKMDLDDWLGNSLVFSIQYCLGSSCTVRLVGGSDLREHLKLSL